MWSGLKKRFYLISTGGVFGESLLFSDWRCVLVKIRTYFQENPDCEI
jgi:hypothetical protein